MAPVSVSIASGCSSSLGISNTAAHSVHSAISPLNSTGTENTALHPGHETSISEGIWFKLQKWLKTVFYPHPFHRKKETTNKK
ncbi:MAG TPA: hypothetical protein DET40_26060 [Lentisphaeria bacterium]|nr:MAG: hypothetical protein A2X45_12860 [Lentisphaerae bacterium GWF2_50_93]HCE47028.1 hypothetical protein [Lentisphaeria bacterium]